MSIESSRGSSWADLGDVLDPIKWDWQDWLPRGFLTLLAGKQGTGKSMLMLRIAACYLRGDPWPDGTPFDDQQGHVLWCEAEASQALNLGRAKEMGLPIDRIESPLADPTLDVSIADAEHREAIQQAAAREEVKLVIVDSLRGIIPGDENDSAIIGPLKWLAQVARDTKTPVILSHHLRKRGEYDLRDGVGLDQVRGSSAITQLTRVVWSLSLTSRTREKKLSVIKNNLAPLPSPLTMKMTTDGIEFGEHQSESPLDEATLIDLFLSELLEEGPMPATTVKAALRREGLSIDKAQRLKKPLGIESVRQNGKWFWQFVDSGQPPANA